MVMSDDGGETYPLPRASGGEPWQQRAADTHAQSLPRASGGEPPRGKSPEAAGAAWQLRDWQQAAIDAYSQHAGRDFLVTACPAAGKTTVGAVLGREALVAGNAQRIVICAPTTHICTQWERTMHRFGLAVQAGRPNDAGPEPHGVHGVAITYQALAAAPHLHFARCDGRRTFVIFDEPHHQAVEGAWGAAARNAFGHEQIAGRLLLSGTPFRTDGRPIPFVSYDPLGQAIENFSYGYGEAIKDGVCRPLEMIRFEGQMRWASKGRDYDADFAEGLPARERARRYRTALQAGAWLPSLLRAAHDRLTLLRTRDGHSDAGGLVVAADQSHARQIAGALRAVIGFTPVLVLSDDERANARIESFSASSEPWMVAVRMVSEGVDIPRLRVGVYATAARTEMHFRQVVGRFVRRQSHVSGEQRAYLYLASDPELLTLARRLASVTPEGVALRDQPIERADASDREPLEEEDEGWIAHDSTAAVADGALDEKGIEFTGEEILALGSACARLGLKDDPVAFGRMGGMFQVLEADWPAVTPAGPHSAGITVTAVAETGTLTISERLEELRSERQRLVREIARLGKLSHEQVNREMKARFGSVATASPKQLERGNAHARKWRDKLYRKAVA